LHNRASWPKIATVLICERIMNSAQKSEIHAPVAAKVCFVIAPIGDAESDVRKRSDQVLKHVISPPVESRGYAPIRADQISEPGMITAQVIQHILDDPLVIADLTGRNPNVFYELAVRHAIRKPFIQVIAAGEQIPFDVAQTRTIYVDHHDLDSVERARQEIGNQIDTIVKEPKAIETPISRSLDLQTLGQSGKAEERSLAEIVTAMAKMRSAVDKLDERLADPAMLLPPHYIATILRQSRPGLPSDSVIEARAIIDSIIDQLSTVAGITDPEKIQAPLARLRHHLNRLLHDSI
jgi:hypothetical protein